MRFEHAITVSTDIDAPVGTVWDVLEPIETHVDWMADAEAIHFRGDRTRGVGTSFVCDTKVGPIRLRDEMEITVWEPGAEMGVEHRGLVTGRGSFRLEPIDLPPDRKDHTTMTNHTTANLGETHLPLRQAVTDAIRDHVKSNLARYKVPREVAFLDELPRNPTGKILRRVLADGD